MQKTPLPITIIGGYLGVGKTTLLNHIIRHTDRRLAIIVNDFGDINIDTDLIENQDGDTINLANGCICCSLVDGYTATLLSLQKKTPDHIIVEASGVADPYKLAQQGKIPGFWLDSIIVLADAETICQKTKDRYVGETVTRQLHGADLIVLNKTDLVSSETKRDVCAWLRGLIPKARVVEATYGIVPLPLLFGDFRLAKFSHNISAKQRDQKPCRFGENNPEAEYETWSYTNDQPLDGVTFQAMVESLPDGIIRAKGILHLRESLTQKHIFQLVGKRWSIEVGEKWGNTQPISKLVMIGLRGSIDRKNLECETNWK